MDLFDLSSAQKMLLFSEIENPQNDFSNYWILNENSFPKFLANAKENLSIEEVRSISNQVTEWIKVSVD